MPGALRLNLIQWEYIILTRTVLMSVDSLICVAHIRIIWPIYSVFRSYVICCAYLHFTVKFGCSALWKSINLAIWNESFTTLCMSAKRNCNRIIPTNCLILRMFLHRCVVQLTILICHKSQKATDRFRLLSHS